MNAKCFIGLTVVIWCASPLSSQSQGPPLSSVFLYQGRLVAGGSPANGLFDLRLGLFRLPSGGALVGNALTNMSVVASNGLFTTSVDFGSDVFDGTTYWIEVGVRPAGSAMLFRTLLPRQRIAGTPYAFYAANAASAGSVAWSGVEDVPAGFRDGLDNDTLYANGAGLLLDGTQFSVSFGGSGAASTAARSDHAHTDLWRLRGNSGTTPDNDFLGTTDNRPLELRVNNVRALRLEPHPNGPNLIGGSSINVIAPSVAGATISGGGTADDSTGNSWTNRVDADYGTVGGGLGNHVGSVGGTLSGGRGNVVGRSAPYATIPGGAAASARAYGQLAYASGSFSRPGDAQSSTYVLRATTSGNTPARMFLDGSSELMRLPNDGRWAFEILIVASSTGANTAGFQARGVIRNVAGATSLVPPGPITPLNLGSDPTSGWVVQVVADDPNDALVVTVSTIFPGSVRWVATVRTTELVF